jgi:hypothetical protein
MHQPSVSFMRNAAGFGWAPRLRAAAIHLALSALVAVFAGVLVFAVWYPYPYREVSGGQDLFRLVVSVDIVLGPLLTFAIFNRSKPWRVLQRDLAVIGVLQLAGLAYGMWTVNLARPVHLAFEVDRFSVVHRIDIPVELSEKAPPGIALAPWGPPTLLALREITDSKERADITLAALGGVPVAARPNLWQPYEAARARVLAAAHPIAQLERRFPSRAGEIQAAVRAAGREPAQVAYLPLLARKAQAWTVLLDTRTAEVIGYLPLDPF